MIPLTKHIKYGNARLPRTLLVLTAALAFSLSSAANAAQIYQFTAELGDEFDTAGTGPLTADERIFADGVSVTFNFTYDSATAATAINQDLSANPAVAPYGLFSIYPGAITEVSGNAAGNTFSATTGTVNVGNSDPGDTTILDGIFAQIDSGFGGFAGFSATTASNNFNLVFANVFTVGFLDLLANQTLPADFPLVTDMGGLNTGVLLGFADPGSTGSSLRFARFDQNISLISVSEPSAVILLLLGLAGLLGRKFRI